MPHYLGWAEVKSFAQATALRSLIQIKSVARGETCSTVAGDS